MVELAPAYLGLSSRLGTFARIFLDLFHNLTDVILSVVDDVSIHSEALVVTSSIFRICRLSLLEVLIGVGLHECIPWVSVRACL
jgi:hypothetical protein